MLVLLGCASEPAPPVTGTCESFCERSLAVGCPNDTPDACATTCEELHGGARAECSDTLGRDLGCLQELTFECGPSGKAYVVTWESVELCRSETQAYVACTFCMPRASDGACDACERVECCAEGKALLGDPNLWALRDCQLACEVFDQACHDACSAKYASVVAHSDALQACRETHCAAECVGSP